MADFQVVIGLEVHAQLLTHTKIFSSAPTTFGAEPNAQTQSLCLGMPGSLPVLNRAAVEMAAKAGFALGCTVNARSEWSRKHYFYPDLPKGYQITQFEKPICEWGELTFHTASGEKSVRIRRIHMEEDAGKSSHEGAGSLVDLNRAGVPLIEIVSEPDLRSADDAVEYLKSLRDILMYLGVNDGNMEEGSFRCDANVSVMPRDSTVLGTRTELKNINSFRFVKQAIEFEAARHVDVITSGGAIIQETRLWDTNKGETRSMRSKEDAHDYRYFPEPDLPPLLLSADDLAKWKASLPELPRARLGRFESTLGLSDYDARLLTADRALADFFERVVAQGVEPKKAANWCLGEMLRLLNDRGATLKDLKFGAEGLAALLKAVESGIVSNTSAKEVLVDMFATGESSDAIIAKKGLAQVNDDGAVAAVVADVLSKSATEVAAYRAGKVQVLGFLVGQVMKAMKGKGNPKAVNAEVKKQLGAKQ